MLWWTTTTTTTLLFVWIGAQNIEPSIDFWSQSKQMDGFLKGNHKSIEWHRVYVRLLVICLWPIFFWWPISYLLSLLDFLIPFNCSISTEGIELIRTNKNKKAMMMYPLILHQLLWFVRIQLRSVWFVAVQ